MASAVASGTAAVVLLTLAPRLAARTSVGISTAANRWGPPTAVFGICAAAVVACGLVVVLPLESATQPPLGASPLHADDALAAVLSWPEVQQLFPGAAWWPARTDLEAPPFRGSPQTHDPGWRVSARQTYALVGATEPEFITAGVDLYDAADQASTAFTQPLSAVEQEQSSTSGPPLGDEHRYAVGDGATTRYVGSAQFRMGPAIVSVRRGSGDAALASPSALARISQLFLPRVQALLDGQLHADRLPTTLAALLPRPGTYSWLAMGSAVRPVEAYAALSGGNDPLPLWHKMQQDGATVWAERQYAVVSDDHQRIDVAIVPFTSAAAAADFAAYATATYQARTGLVKFDPGNTGPNAVFLQFQDGSYVLEFAKGAIIARVELESPHASISAGDVVSENTVLSLAETWSADLP